MDTYQTSIIKNIKRVYLRRMFPPALYLTVLLLMWVLSPISQLMHPVITDLADLSASKNSYVSVSITDLHFTGYTQTIFGWTTGYYYYTFQDGRCLFVLLSPNTCESGLPSIKAVTIGARIRNHFKEYDELTQKLAADLNWTAPNARNAISRQLLSEPDFHKTISRLFLLFYFCSGGLAALQILLYLLYILFPVLSGTCRELGLYGNASKLLTQAEEELATLPQLATEDMYITEHFFIAFAIDRVAVVPIQEIVWIYKHSTLHKLLWYHFSISYTLHITANKHFYIQCPKNMKSDIDGIIDYLSEANHEIIVGFDEANRKKVQERLGGFHLIGRTADLFHFRSRSKRT